MIGQSLEAAVHLRAAGSISALLSRSGAALPTLFITSQVDVETTPTVPDEEPASGAMYTDGDGNAVRISVSRARGVKCDRCWRYVASVTSAAGREGVCPRCEDALEALGR